MNLRDELAHIITPTGASGFETADRVLAFLSGGPWFAEAAERMARHRHYRWNDLSENVRDYWLEVESDYLRAALGVAAAGEKKA